MPCTVCNHPHRHDIDLALLAGGSSLRSLKEQYGPSRSSLFRHHKHLVAKLRKSRENLESSQAQVSLLKLNAFLDHVQRGVEAAAADGDLDRVFKGSHIGSRIIHQINHLDVPLELDTVYRLISSPGFVSQDSLLPTGPQIITDLHQALVDQAFFPCPDPPPEIVAAEAAEDDADALEGPGECRAGECLAADNSTDSFLKTENPELVTRHEALSLLQQHFPDLYLSAAAVALAEKDPENKRDTSATLPRQTGPHAENIFENQQDDCYEKNYAKHPNVGRESVAPLAALESEAHPANSASDPPPADIQVSLPLDSLETRNSELETTFPEPETALPETRNQELETAFEESVYCPLPTANCLSDPLPSANSLSDPPPSANCLYDETAARADELFEISHGYKRHNPPKHIPNRRREEDFRSSSIFGDPRKILG